MLDHFGGELEKYIGPPRDFCSKVLTLVLQRQLWGIPDTYAPCIHDALSTDKPGPTISEVTEFYLGSDPIDPDMIPSFCRNLVYISQVRWHLGIVMGKFGINDTIAYNMILYNQDVVMEHVSKYGMPEPTGDQEIPAFNIVEADVVIVEEIEEFFVHELREFVCTILCFYSF